MSVDTKYLLCGLINAFSNTLGVALSKETKKYADKMGGKFEKLSKEDRKYYNKYGDQLANQLFDYIKGIKKFAINLEDGEIIHDFRLINGKGKVFPVSLKRETVSIRNIIPNRLMKICKYNGNTNMCKNYNKTYTKLEKSIYDESVDKAKNGRYSDLSDKFKDKHIYKPVTDLFVDTLSKKRKCAPSLYDYIFNDGGRLVVYTYKNKFSVYDFMLADKWEVAESCRIKRLDTNRVSVEFNNKACFILELKTNGTDIQEHVSLKFNIKFKNMNKLLCAVENYSI